jgi:multiple sugar transport system permease protein
MVPNRRSADTIARPSRTAEKRRVANDNFSGTGTAAITRRGNKRTTLFAWLLFAPALVWVALVTFVPIAKAIEYSLFQTNFTAKVKFTGLHNYVRIFTGPGAARMLAVTAIFVICSLALAVAVSLALALLLNQKLAGMTGFRTLLLLPWVTSGLLAGLLWKWVISPLVGPVPYLLTAFDHGRAGGNIDLLSTQTGAMAVLILVSVWKLYPFGMVLFLASIRTIPKELFEAARVDGATWFRQLVHITLPAIKSTLIVVAIFFTITFLTLAEVPLVITGGGPNGATDIAGLQLYQQAFQNMDTGGASALAVTIFLVNVILGGIYIRALRSDDL